MIRVAPSYAKFDEGGHSLGIDWNRIKEDMERPFCGINAGYGTHSEHAELLLELSERTGQVADLFETLNQIVRFGSEKNMQAVIDRLHKEMEELKAEHACETQESIKELDRLNQQVLGLKHELGKRKSEYQAMQKKIAELEAENADLLTKVDPEKDAAMKARLDSLTQMTNHKNQVINEKENEIAAKDIEIRNLKAKIAELEGVKNNERTG